MEKPIPARKTSFSNQMKFLIFSRKDGSSGCGDLAAAAMILEEKDYRDFWAKIDVGFFYVGAYVLYDEFGVVRVKDW